MAQSEVGLPRPQSPEDSRATVLGLCFTTHSMGAAGSGCSIRRVENPCHRANPRCMTLLIHYTAGLRFCFDLNITVPWLFLFEISTEVIIF